MTAGQFLKHKCGEHYHLFPHQFSKQDIITWLQEFSDLKNTTPLPQEISDVKSEWERRSDWIKTKGVDVDEIFKFFEPHILQSLLSKREVEGSEDLALKFAEWLVINNWQSGNGVFFVQRKGYGKPDYYKTIKELMQIFKQETNDNN